MVDDEFRAEFIVGCELKIPSNFVCERARLSLSSLSLSLSLYLSLSLALVLSFSSDGKIFPFSFRGSSLETLCNPFHALTVWESLIVCAKENDEISSSRVLELLFLPSTTTTFSIRGGWNWISCYRNWRSFYSPPYCDDEHFRNFLTEFSIVPG